MAVCRVSAVAHCAQSHTQVRDRRRCFACVEVAAVSAGLHRLVVL